MRKIRQVFTREGRDQWLLSLTRKSPRASLILGATIAGMGYILFALFPLLSLIGVLKLVSLVTNAGTFDAWLHAFVWLLLTVAVGLISFTQFRAKISLPTGLGLKDDKAPRLYELLAELAENYSHPRIHRVVLHDKFSLELVPVPRFGLPFLTTNVLYIGLPILQGLSPAQFRGALARILGQYSGTHNRKTHWIYRWHQYCTLYQRASRKHRSGLYRPLQLFCRFYLPLLNYWAAGTLRQDELEGDVCMMEIMNDTEAADVILRYEVCQAFLKTKYWPKIYAMFRKNPANPNYLPHINMVKVLRNSLTDNEFAQTMKTLINQETTWRNTQPALHERLENIGQSKLRMPPPVMETAAQRYLGEAFGAVIKLLDKQWLARHGKAHANHQKKQTTDSGPGAEDTFTPESAQVTNAAPPQQRAATASTTSQKQKAVDERGSNIGSDNETTITVADRKRLAELKQRAETGRLKNDEAWELAYLTEKLEDKSLAITLYQQILKQNPNHAKTLFAVGRIMLTRMDQTGVKVLERAMELDSGCVAQGCWMLAKYYKSVGDETRSRQYLERAAKVAA